MATKRERIHFASVEEILGAPITKENTTEIRIDQIRPFEHHPFKVLDDEKMEDLTESIRQNGVLVPVLVRPDDEGNYEMISGHRRMHAAKLAGLTTIPAVIKEMTDDDATIAMVDTNIQREEILPSERAFALKMKMDAMRHQGTSRHHVEKLEDQDNEASDGETSGHLVEKLNSSGARATTADSIGEVIGMTGRQVNRYIRLTELNPKLLNLVDEKKLAMTIAVDISYFNDDIQQWLYEYIRENGTVKPRQIEELKACNNLDNITQFTMIGILNDAMPKPKANGRIQFSQRTLDKYFPPSYSTADRERILIELLKQWHDEKEKEADAT